ncbi:MAG: hypothetical protein ACKJSG_03910 [Lentisphaeria bacterium]
MHVCLVGADAHDAQRKRLPGRTGAAQQVVDDSKVDLPVLGLELAPVQPEISRRTRQPVQARILIRELVERLPAHTGVRQEVIGLSGIDGHYAELGKG